MMHLPSGPELLLICGVLVLLFGAKKVPQLMKGLGEGIREFRLTAKELTEGDRDEETK